MSWIFLAAGAQLINAVVAMVDKYLVTDEKRIPRPFVYAFYTSLVTAFWLVIYPLGYIPGLSGLGIPSFSNIKMPTLEVMALAFFSAYTFFIAIVSLYGTLKRADTSDVMPVVGAVSAIVTFGLSYLFLSAQHSPNFIWGVLLLATGTFMVSHLRFNTNIALAAFHSGLFFALHYISMKGMFIATNFDDAFFWSRIALVLFALSWLLVPNYLELIKSQNKVTSKNTGLLIFGTKLLAGVAAFMILKATDLGDVAVVQALDGLKFVFILLIGVLVGRWLPASAGESDRSLLTLARKFIYVTVICVGFILLFR
ncbi:MAG: hypothetical protein WD605_00485 [Candidatus Paceibacterota bacterium]